MDVVGSFQNRPQWSHFLEVVFLCSPLPWVWAGPSDTLTSRIWQECWMPLLSLGYTRSQSIPRPSLSLFCSHFCSLSLVDLLALKMLAATLWATLWRVLCGKDLRVASRSQLVTCQQPGELGFEVTADQSDTLIAVLWDAQPAVPQFLPYRNHEMMNVVHWSH